MTTSAEYKAYFKSMLAAEQLTSTITDIDPYLDRAIAQGIKDLWYADNWTFRMKDDSMTVSSGATSSELPRDFSAAITFRENVSQRGKKLIHKSPEEFDRLIPKQSFRTGTPEFYKLFMEEDAGKLKWYIVLFPQPNASFSLKMLYLVQSPDDVEGVPLVAHAALEACIAKHIYPYSHAGRQSAVGIAELELKRLAVTSKSDQAPISFFPTQNEEHINRNPFNAI